MRVQGFHHFAIQVKDLERMAAFYTGVLGLPEQARHLRPDGSLRSIWLALPGGFLALEQVAETPEPGGFPSERPGFFLLALRVAREERTSVLVELERHGVEVVKQSRWTVYLRDPEGNRIGLSHHPHDPLEG